MTNLKGKRVLVTGGTGSIGSEIVRQVLAQSPQVVRVLSRNELNQFEFQKVLKDYPNVRFLLGDIRDKERLRRAVQDIDIIFHASALKHVPFCEYNPFEAVKTNVLGTQNLVEVALDEGVQRVVAISTDKSVSPTNTMGATKLLVERLLSAANFYRGFNQTVFTAVRFGNVLGSSGSVLPVWKKQIESGGPVTVTDPEMSRFVMSIPQAVSLVLSACNRARGGEIFVLKMPVANILDLAKATINVMAPKFKQKPEDIGIEFIGRRPGEKEYEELLSREESPYAEELDNMWCLHPSWNRTDQPFEMRSFSSQDEKLLTIEEIEGMLKSQELDGSLTDLGAKYYPPARFDEKDAWQRSA